MFLYFIFRFIVCMSAIFMYQGYTALQAPELRKISARARDILLQYVQLQFFILKFLNNFIRYSTYWNDAQNMEIIFHAS